MATGLMNLSKKSFALALDRLVYANEKATQIRSQ